jgi:hypothetical protein
MLRTQVPTSSILRSLQILGLNAVPAAGYLAARWSPGTMLLLYFCEGLLIAPLIVSRILLHRRTTRKRGHWQALAKTRGPGQKGTLLSGFLWVAIPFNLAHGFFLFMILFAFMPRLTAGEAVVDLVDFQKGILGVALMLAAGFVLDLFGLAKRPFRWIEQIVEHSIERVVLVHLSILFGLAGMAFFDTPRTFFMVFIAFKTLTDLAWMLPQGEVSEEPPAWARWMDRFGPNKDGETFRSFWLRTTKKERSMRIRNEETPADVVEDSAVL